MTKCDEFNISTSPKKMMSNPALLGTQFGSGLFASLIFLELVGL